MIALLKVRIATELIVVTLFGKLRCAIKLIVWRNASKFAIFYIHENPKLLFPFRATLLISLMNALVYVDIDQGIY